MSWKRWSKAGLVGTVLSLMLGMALAAITTRNMVSDVRGTKHNLSASTTYTNKAISSGTLNVPTRTVKTAESEVCVFCHTPHGASTAVVAPLWNRKLSPATYTPYSSTSMDATSISAVPGDSSKLCLSCHDGTMAINDVNVLRGAFNQTLSGTWSNSPYMPFRTGGDAKNGFTPNLGTDLTNDHPISFTYNQTVVDADGELRTPDNVVVGNRVPLPGLAGNKKIKLPLVNNQIECATCHDPHIRDLNETTASGTIVNGNAKFLRLNRFQVKQKTSSGTLFDSTNDIMCLACHNKGDDSWNFSAHAIASQTYASTTAVTTYREFPVGLQVFQAACLNCHDTHTVQGSRRLLREGTSSTATSDQYQLGITPGDMTKSAIEKTCYACHDGTTNVVTPSTTVPNIRNDFGLTYRMPVATNDQGTAGTTSGTVGTTEVHNINSKVTDSINCSTSGANNKCGADLIEARANLGFANLGNRHAECTDCHNPHRVIKGQKGLVSILNATTTNQKAGTHVHEDGSELHDNLISGVLRGSWGVEPKYASATFTLSGTALLPQSFDVKRGDPGTNANTAVTQPYVTREYQICLKCHSNYGYDDDNKYPSSGAGRRPLLGGLNRTGPNLGRTNYTTYTNQAMEFLAPDGINVTSDHRKDVNAGALKDGGWSSPTYDTNNHRSWHPVMGPTGRTSTERGGAKTSNWRAPWNNNLGNQTMYCSDCHGSDTTNTSGQTALPKGNADANSAYVGENGNPWGPHGSDNAFILKGVYDVLTGYGQESNGLCFKCHNASVYAPSGGGDTTGFYINSGSGSGKDGHKIHNSTGTTSGKIKCNWCHIAVPHGWKNKALLVNLRDVGPEAGKPPGTDVGTGPYSNGPYYRNAKLRVITFQKSGNWTDTDCGGRDYMKNTMCSSVP